MNKDALIVGGLAIGTVAIAAVLAGRQSSSGTTFAAANPNAVAAVENGIGAQIADMNAAGVAKAQIAATTIVQLASAQQQLLVAQHQDNTQLAETALSTDAATKQAVAASNAASAVAQINAASNAEIARNQTTQVQAAAGAQKTSSFWSAAGSIVSSVASVFSHL